MYDKIVKVSNSQIQHGTNNNRIYLMNLVREDMPKILDDLDHMADTYNYTKIFTRVPQDLFDSFLENGYVAEAIIPNFFKGEQDCIFMGKFIDKERSKQVDQELNEKVVEVAVSKGLEDYNLPKDFSFEQIKPEDADQMSKLYASVFDSYPFPISDPVYICKTMEDNIIYFAVRKKGQLIALSACEISRADKSVEMTDFAVLPEYRGYNLSGFLLQEMEKEMKKNKMKTAYTIARSCSYGMNSTFAKGGYKFSGVLVKNTQIGGEIEDMNVWYKSL